MLQLLCPDVLAQNPGQGGAAGHIPGVVGGSPLQPALLVHLARIGPLLAHLGLCRVEQQLAPLVIILFVRQEDVPHMYRDRFFRSWSGVVQGREERVQSPAAARTAPDPAERAPACDGLSRQRLSTADDVAPEEGE
ncbi:hypothetical protein [Streptomyces sp. NPDC001970]